MKVIAVRIATGLPVHVECSDLVGAGMLGLVDAARRFDKSKKVTFAAYAGYRIQGAILDYLRTIDWVPRKDRQTLKRIKATIAFLNLSLGRLATEEEVAKSVGLTLEAYRTIRLRTGFPIPISPHYGDRDRARRSIDPPAFEESHPDNIAAGSERERIVDDALGFLRPRQRQAVILYYRDELTMTQVGVIMHVNESRICQILAASRIQIRAALALQGITSYLPFAA